MVMYQSADIVPIKTAPQFSILSTEPLTATIPINAPLHKVKQSYFEALVEPETRRFAITLNKALKLLAMNIFWMIFEELLALGLNYP
jgi:hypothetical protein